MRSDNQSLVTGGRAALSAVGSRSKRDWWPARLNLRLFCQHSSLSDPLDRFDPR